MRSVEARQVTGRLGSSGAMTAVLMVVAALVALWLIHLAWASIRSEKRSIEGYEHAMEVLRDLSSRTAPDKGVRARESARAARAHVRAGAVPDLRPRQDILARLAERLPRSPAVREQLTDTSAAFDRGLVSKAYLTKADASKTRARVAGGQRVAAARSDAAPMPASTQQREQPGAEEGAAQGDSTPRLVFVSDDLADDLPDDLGTEPPSGGSPEPAVSGRARLAGALASLRSSRPRFGLAVGMASVVLAAVALAAVLVSTHAVSTRDAVPPREAASHQLPHSTARSSQHHSPPPTVPSQLLPVSSDAQGAVYRPPQGTYVVDLAATGPCWIEIRQGPSGPTLFEGTLAAGQDHTVAMSGPLWIRVGNAAHVDVRVGTMAVQLPVDSSSPFNLSFEPA